MKMFIQTQIDALKQHIKEQLPDYNSGKPLDMLKALLGYDMVLGQSYTLWLMLLDRGYKKTPKGQAVVKLALDVEFREYRHQHLLTMVAAALDIPVTFKNVESVYESVDQVMLPILQKEVRSLSASAPSVDGFFIMAILGNAAPAYLPWFTQTAEHRLNSGSAAYFRSRGRDSVLAAEFLNAANDEYIQQTIDLAGVDHYRRRRIGHSQQQRMEEITEKLKTVFTAMFSFAKVTDPVAQ
jgi:hypothetical protein